MKAKTIMILLILLPMVHANILPSDCSQAPVDYMECENILNDNSLTQLEKEDLYLNLLNNQSNLPSHDFVWNWNNKISFQNAPNGVQSYSNGIITDAWIKIISINKSVYDINQGKWFVENNGNILTRKNYSVQMPPSGPLPGECNTNYSYNIQNDNLTISGNSQTIGSNDQTNYSLSLNNETPINFQSSWNLEAQLVTDHYFLQLVCAPATGYYWNECDYSNTTYDNYSVNLTDNFKATILDNSYSVQTAIDDKKGNKKMNKYQVSKEAMILLSEILEQECKGIIEKAKEAAKRRKQKIITISDIYTALNVQ